MMTDGEKKCKPNPEIKRDRRPVKSKVHTIFEYKMYRYIAHYLNTISIRFRTV